MRQGLGVRRRLESFLSPNDHSGSLQQHSDRACRRPFLPRLIPFQHSLQLPRPPTEVRLPQIQHLLLDLLRCLVGIPLRRSALLPQPFQSHRLITPQPHIPSFPCDPVTLAQFAHAPFLFQILQDKLQLLFHHTARFPWHALCFTRACHPFAVSGIRPVHSVKDLPGLYPPTPPPLIEVLLQTKAQVQFNRPVNRLSKPLFHVF